jgi:hypothetical protein
LPVRAALVALAVLLSACAAPERGDATAELAAHLSGHFSSAAQAAADPAYSEIELRVVPIWTERSDGPWLYVEQADARTPQRPYRQRVYRLERAGELFLSHIYTFRGDPLRHAGAWQQGRPLAGLAPSDLELRTGCAVALTRDSHGRYRGGTRGRDCASELRGARYATSTVTLDAGVLESWDRGYDDAGRQVWGATGGAYRFVRRAWSP